MQQCIQLSRTNGRGLTFSMVRRIRHFDDVEMKRNVDLIQELN